MALVLPFPTQNPFAYIERYGLYEDAAQAFALEAHEPISVVKTMRITRWISFSQAEKKWIARKKFP